ncbi:MAG: ribosome silencing factor [Chloroflexi bacterium]|nr:ribosome silencing factor [Chloroflexota bacterium]
MAQAEKESSIAEVARHAVDVASENLASDVALLDLRGVSDFTDYFVIASGETPRHLESLAEDVSLALKERGTRLHHREGTGQGGWILLDFPGLVVHLFTRQVRERYGLERLWSRATEIVRVQ